MLAALRSCGGKASVCECKQNKLQTGQNPHLAVEPAAPAVLCREKMCWLFQISRRIFLHSKRYFFALFRRSCQQSPLVQSTRKGKFNITSQIRNYFCTIFENVSHQERFRDKFDRPPALSADSSSLLKPPDGAGLIFLSTRDSCFIYRLGCSQCCLCVSAVSSQILEVTDPPEGISCTDSHHLLAELCGGGELIQRLSDHRPRLRDAAGDAPGGHLASSYSIFAMLPSRYAAPQATFKLRTSTRHKGELCDSDKAGS